jgi:1-acyl-sn-glycerol-3-phosphate acyltransferase
VRQGAADRGAIRQALSLLDRGELVCIFPEGTRSEDGDLSAAQPGAAMIAAKAGVPLIPVAIHGTWEAMPRNARWMRPARISLTFGPPIRPRAAGGGGRARELAGVSQRIMDEIDRLLVERQLEAA